MKRTLTCILTITTLLTLLFTSCNADASAGLFKQLADAKKPVEIRYRQIIGKDDTDLYFLTNDGIYKTDGRNTTTTVRENKKGHPVYEAYLDTTNDLIIYLINDEGNAEIHQMETDGSDDVPLTTTDAEDMDPGWKMKQLLANGLFVIKGTTPSSDNSFLLAQYNSTPPEQYDKKILMDIPSGYDRDAVLQMSGRQHWGIGGLTASTAPLILSFVTSGGSYEHYYTDGAFFHQLTSLDKSLAGFWTNGTSLYLITKDGNLYGSVVPAGPGSTAPTPMKDLSRQFPSNAFVYGMSSGGTTYLITKTTTANEALFVVSIDNTNAVDTTVVSTGYASQMSNVNIVSAFEKAAGSLLVATEKNGMFDITITDAATVKDPLPVLRITPCK